MGEVEDARSSTLVDRTLALVAYAEVRAIMLAWAGAPGWDPIMRAREALRRLLDEPGDLAGPALVCRAQEALRADSSAVLERLVARQGPWPFDRLLGSGQVGSAAGLEPIFHDAGQLAPARRRDDPRTLSAAVGLADFLRNRRAGRSTG